MLKVNNINVYYGKVEALFNVSFEVGDDEIVSLIGANGAGKTTLMKTIVGINRTAQGSIEYNGRAIHNQKPHKSIYDGIVYVPEGREVFPQMTVLENLSIADKKKTGYGLGRCVRKERRQEYREMLADLGLGLEEVLQRLEPQGRHRTHRLRPEARADRLEELLRWGDHQVSDRTDRVGDYIRDR